MSCSICLQNISRKNEVSIDICKHVFCYNCIIKWHEINSNITNYLFHAKCPICRRLFNKENIVYHNKIQTRSSTLRKRWTKISNQLFEIVNSLSENNNRTEKLDYINKFLRIVYENKWILDHKLVNGVFVDDDNKLYNVIVKKIKELQSSNTDFKEFDVWKYKFKYIKSM